MSPAIPESDGPAASDRPEGPPEPDGGHDPVQAEPDRPDGAAEPDGGPEPYPVPPARPAGPAGRSRPVSRTLAGAALVTLGGLPLGLLWAVLAPSVPVLRTERGVVLAQPQPEGFVAADGWFAMLGCAYGVLVTIVAWWLVRRSRGPVGLVAVALGGLGAALVAWQLGRRFGLARFQRLTESAPVGSTFDRPPDLRAGEVDWLYGILPVVSGTLLLPAFAAVVTYTLLAGWSRYPGLRPEADPPVPAAWPGAPGQPGSTEPPGQPGSTDGLSSGWPEPPTRSTGPAPPGPGPAAPPPG